MKRIMIGLFSLVCTASAMAGPPVFETTTILADEMWNNPTSTVIEDDGTIHSAYMTQFDTESTTKEIWYARKDPEAPWQFTRITNNGVREEFPRLEVDPAGNVHIAFHSGISPTGTNYIRYVNNIGAAPGAFNSIVDITGAGFVIVEFAIDSTGKIHFVFRTQNTPGPQDVYYTTHTPGVGNGPLMNLSQSAGQEDSSPQIAIDADDKVHVVWQRGSALSGPLEYMNDVSGAFQSVATGVGTVLESWIIIDDFGKIGIFYRPNFDAIMYIETDDGRGGFTAPAPVYSGAYRSSFMERVAVDGNGHRYVAFASNVGNLGTHFVQETDDGWQTPQLLSAATNGNQGTSISINTDGKLAVTYSRSQVVDGVVMADMYLACTTIPQGSCAGDLTDDGSTNLPDGQVNVFDLFVLLANWNMNGPGADLAEPTDVVDVFDLFVMLDAWGACP